MKKLLSLLGSVLIAASASTAVVACSYGPSISKAVKRETKFYSTVSAEAAKEGILADQDLNIAGQSGVGIATDFSSSYLGDKQVNQSFKGLYNPKQGAKPDDTAKVSSLFASVFGASQGGVHYSIADSYNDLKSNNGVEKGTRLYDLINNPKSHTKDLKQPSSSISSTLNLVSGLANLVFKNDFDPSIGETAISMLTSGTVKNALSSPAIQSIFPMVDSILTTNKTQISALVGSITQSDIAKNKTATYSDVLDQETNRLFGSLIYLISLSKATKDSPVYKYDFGTKDTNLNNATDAFFRYVLKNDTTGLLEAKRPDSETFDYTDLLESISGIATFGVTLLHYFRAFDKYYPKVVAPLDGNHLFGDVSNHEAINNVLQKIYGPTTDSTDDFWYKSADNDDFYTKLNIQNLISDLQYYLSPADNTGHQTLRIITELFGNPSDDGFNPIISTVVSSLVKYKDLVKDKIASLPIIGGQAGDITNTIFGIGQEALRELIDWFTSDGYDGANSGIISIVKSLTTILGGIPLSGFANEKTLKIFEIIDGIISYLNSPDGEAFFSHPWSVIYGGGILNSVGQIMRNVASNDPNPDDVLRIGYALEQLNDLYTILTMKGKDLAQAIGILIGNSNFVIPDWLYLANESSISEFVDYLANKEFVYTENPGTSLEKKHNSNEYNRLEDNKYFALNSKAFANIVNSLLPYDKTYDANSKSNSVYYIDGEEKVYVTPLIPLLHSILDYGGSTKPQDIKLGDKTITNFWVHDNANNNDIEIFSTKDTLDKNGDFDKGVYVSTRSFEYLLGVDDFSVPSKLNFMPGSLFMSVSNLYGHWYTTDKDKKPVIINDDVDGVNANANGIESIFGAFSDFAQFASNSITTLTKDVYDKYYDPKNWKILNVKQKGLENTIPGPDEIQQLDYDLQFTNPDLKKTFTYHVMMQRKGIPDPSISNAEVGWRLLELKLQK